MPLTGIPGSVLSRGANMVLAFVQGANTIKAKKFHLVRSPSEWVHAVILTCNDEIAVWFKHGEKIIGRTHVHPGPYLGIGGAPTVCCVYPKTAGALGRQLFNLALAWAYAGEFVHAFLYKKQPYRIVQPPALPVG
jgi:hypothetical protein